MNDIEFRVLKMLVFIASYALASFLSVKILRRSFPGSKASDVEVIAVSAFFGAVTTGIITALVRFLI